MTTQQTVSSPSDRGRPARSSGSGTQQPGPAAQGPSSQVQRLRDPAARHSGSGTQQPGPMAQWPTSQVQWLRDPAARPNGTVAHQPGPVPKTRFMACILGQSQRRYDDDNRQQVVQI